MTTGRPAAPPDAPTARRRPLLFALGLVCTALGVVGAVLPLVPTTPFLLLATACFARSSPRWHARLIESRMFGPYLRQWQTDRTIPRAAKRKAYLVVVATFGLSIAVTDSAFARAFLPFLGLCLLVFLRWLPTTKEAPPEP